MYKKCSEYAAKNGVIIADTKFEFGLDENGELVLGDEVLTPDSSRFWPAKTYEVGRSQKSFDKQYTGHNSISSSLPISCWDKIHFEAIIFEYFFSKASTPFILTPTQNAQWAAASEEQELMREQSWRYCFYC